MKNFHVIGAMKEELADIAKVRAKPGLTIHQCGVGKVNAALAATQACLAGADAVIVIGTAGGLDPGLVIGDIVVSNSAQQHDVDVSPLGFVRGEIPFEPQSLWLADQQMITKAKNAPGRLALSRIHIGRVLTGDRFIANRNEALWLHKNLDGACIDMEGAAVAQVCHKLSVPWVIIRMISDSADEKATVSFPRLLALASERCAAIVLHLVETD